jgi:putative copper export protein
VNALLAGVGWLDLGATATLAGGLVYGRLVAEPSAAGARALRVAAGLLVLMLLAEFTLTALRMRAVAEMGTAAVLADLPATRWGRLWIVRMLGLGIMAMALRVPRPSWSLLAPLGAVWLLTRSFQGHAGAHGTLPAVIDWAHLLAGSAWLGGLVQLELAPDDPTPHVALRVRALATAALALVIPAGIYAAFLHVPSLDRLFDTPYGRSLLVKLVLVAVLLGLGAMNHFRHVPSLVGGRTGAGSELRRTVRIEVMLGAVVLLLSALLGVLPMPHEFQP